MSLIEKVIAIQEKNRLSDESISKMLGVSRPLWSRYHKYPQKARVIVSPVLRGILRNYPELESDLIEFIRGNGKEK